MRILLLNPPGAEFVRAGSRWPHRRVLSRLFRPYFPFPFALAYATSRLRECGHDARLIDCPVMKWDWSELEKEITSFSPDLIVSETSAPSFVVDRTLPAHTGTIPVCAAGAFATARSSVHLEAGFTYVFVGEYEFHIADMVSALVTRSELPPYVATASRPQAQHAPLIGDLDLLPLPFRDPTTITRYHDPFAEGRNVTVLSSKGCPFHCSFCTLSPYLGQSRYRTRKISNVMEEIAMLRKTFAVDEVMFDDDTITVNRHHLLSLCAEIRRVHPGLQWSCMGNVPVDEECARAMAAAGCRAIKLGVESGTQEVLDRIPKGITLTQIRETFSVLKRHGIQRHATIMIGLPGDTYNGAMATVDFVLSLKPDSVQFSTATPYPGTPFLEEASREGWLATTDVSAFNGAGGTPLSYPGFSEADIRRAFKAGMRRWHQYMFLHRPSVVWHHLQNVVYR